MSAYCGICHQGIPEVRKRIICVGCDRQLHTGCALELKACPTHGCTGARMWHMSVQVGSMQDLRRRERPYAWKRNLVVIATIATALGLSAVVFGATKTLVACLVLLIVVGGPLGELAVVTTILHVAGFEARWSP
jgi:hypothetical protein